MEQEGQERGKGKRKQIIIFLHNRKNTEIDCKKKKPQLKKSQGDKMSKTKEGINFVSGRDLSF